MKSLASLRCLAIAGLDDFLYPDFRALCRPFVCALTTIFPEVAADHTVWSPRVSLPTLLTSRSPRREC